MRQRQEDRESIILDYIASKFKANFGDVRPCLETQKLNKTKQTNNKMASRPLSQEGGQHIHGPLGSLSVAGEAKRSLLKEK